MVKYRLIYFNAMGRGEMARLLFAQAGVEYEDVRVNHEEFAAMKDKLPFGQLPVLEVDGVTYCQSSAIVNYLAREFNLAGKNSLEMMRSETVGRCLVDMLMKLPFSEKDEEKKKEGIKKAFAEVIPPLLQKIEKMLRQNNDGDGYFLSELSAGDIAWMSCAQFIEKRSPGILSTVPKLAALAKRVEAEPQIAAWIKARPKTDM